MALSRPALQDIIDRIAADIKSKISGATTLALRSVLRVLARVFGGSIHLLYGYIDNIVDELFVTTASTTYLERLGAEYGVLRNAAVAATGTVTITGITGTAIPAGTELTSSSGQSYTTDALATIDGGTVDVDVTASVAGADGNESAAAELSFVSPIVGVDTVATIDSDGIAGGTDEETDTAYRARILQRKRQAPAGGNENDYEAWCLEVSGVTRVWTVPELYGRGTIGVFFVRDGDDDIYPDSTEIQTVRDYLVSHVDVNGRTVGIPVTAEPGLFVLAPEPQAVNLELAIYPNTATVQAAIEAEIADLLYREGGPGDTIYLSALSEAISAATGEERHRIVSPTDDIGAGYNKVLELGDVTWSDY